MQAVGLTSGGGLPPGVSNGVEPAGVPFAVPKPVDLLGALPAIVQQPASKTGGRQCSCSSRYDYVELRRTLRRVRENPLSKSAPSRLVRRGRTATENLGSSSCESGALPFLPSVSSRSCRSLSVAGDGPDVQVALPSLGCPNALPAASWGWLLNPFGHLLIFQACLAAS